MAVHAHDFYGDGFGLIKHPQQLQHLQHSQYQQFPIHHHQLSSALPGDFVFSATKSQSRIGHSQFVAAQVERHSREIDRYINLQSQGLKSALQEQRKQDLATLFCKLETRAGTLLRQKDEDILQARKRRIELEDFMMRMEMESQSWKRIAGENEAIISYLNTNLQQLRQKQQQEQQCIGAVDDAESCYYGRQGQETEHKDGAAMAACKACKCRNSSVLFLPCRHLCCCRSCESRFAACPVCKSPKKGSIEALIS